MGRPTGGQGNGTAPRRVRLAVRLGACLLLAACTRTAGNVRGDGAPRIPEADRTGVPEASVVATETSAAAEADPPVVPAPEAGDAASGAPAAPVTEEGDAAAADATVQRSGSTPGNRPGCEVVVDAVLEAEVSRGSGVLPPPGLSPEQADWWMAEDHAETHLDCTYRVRINGAAYAYEEIADQGFMTVGPELDPGLCSQEGHRAEVARHLRVVTDCGSPDGLRRSDIRLRPIPP